MIFKTKEEHDLHIYLMVRNVINDQSAFNLNSRESFKSLREAHSMLREEVDETVEELDDVMLAEDKLWKMIKGDASEEDVMAQMEHIEACCNDLIIEAVHIAAVANKAVTQFKLQRKEASASGN